MNVLMTNLSFCTSVLGLFIVFPLVALARKRSASLWLALYLLMISMSCLANVIVAQYPASGVLLWWVQTCLGPFYYCYIRAMVGLGNSWRQSMHFVPVALYFLAASILLAMGQHGAGLLSRWSHLSYTQLAVYQVLSAPYVLIGPYRLTQYGRYLREHYSSTKDRDLTWLTRLSAVLALLWLDWVLAAQFRGGWWLWHAAVCLATFFFVGWYGLRQAAVFVPVNLADGMQPQPGAGAEPARAPLLSVVRVPVMAGTAAVAAAAETTATVGVASVPVKADAPTESDAGAEAEARAEPRAETAAAAETETEAEKYARSGMTEAAEQLIGERLARRMAQQRDYLESDLRLTELAERVGTTPQLLSQYINRVLGANFFDYINGLRIAEVQRMMRDPAHAGSTLLELAHAAGFNSKSTFNTYFKNISGMAPSNWRSQYSAAPVARAG